MYNGTCNCHLPEVCPANTEGQLPRFRAIVALRCSDPWDMSGAVITGTCMSKSGNCRKHELREWERHRQKACGKLLLAVHTSWQAGVGRLKVKFFFFFWLGSLSCFFVGRIRRRF